MLLDLSEMTVLLDKLHDLKIEVAGPAADKAIRAGARVIRDAMEEAAPVLDKKTPGSNALPPGSLKAGMRVFVPQDESPKAALIGPAARVEYVARFVEYGHRIVSGGTSRLLPNGKTRGNGKVSTEVVPPHPFLRPAFESSIAGAEAAMKESLSKAIQETVS
jgi:HK97 gp10 family phage protein